MTFLEDSNTSGDKFRGKNLDGQIQEQTLIKKLRVLKSNNFAFKNVSLPIESNKQW